MQLRNNVILMEQEEYDDYILTGNIAPLNKPITDDLDELTTATEPIKVSLYDLNKQMIAQMPALTEEDLSNKEAVIEQWIWDGHRSNYYMLLCHELNYYTVFHAIDDCLIVDNFIAEFFDLLTNYLGPIHDIHLDNNDTIAVWAEWQDDKEVHCFYLFPYDRGVVEF